MTIESSTSQGVRKAQRRSSHDAQRVTRVFWEGRVLAAGAGGRGPGERIVRQRRCSGKSLVVRGGQAGLVTVSSSEAGRCQQVDKHLLVRSGGPGRLRVRGLRQGREGKGTRGMMSMNPEDPPFPTGILKARGQE